MVRTASGSTLAVTLLPESTNHSGKRLRKRPRKSYADDDAKYDFLIDDEPPTASSSKPKSSDGPVAAKKQKTKPIPPVRNPATTTVSNPATANPAYGGVSAQATSGTAATLNKKPKKPKKRQDDDEDFNPNAGSGRAIKIAQVVRPPPLTDKQVQHLMQKLRHSDWEKKDARKTQLTKRRLEREAIVMEQQKEFEELQSWKPDQKTHLFDLPAEVSVSGLSLSLPMHS